MPDIVVIKTCGFIEPAKVEALEAIRQALKQKKRGRVGKVIVTGCLSERLGKDLLQEAAHIDAIVGLAGRDSLDKILLDIDSQTQPVLRPGRCPCKPDDRIVANHAEHWAYLRISRLQSQIAFCTIPAIRDHSAQADGMLLEKRFSGHRRWN
jgi:ribosomal protein S12 methylthiotransferase